MKDFGTFEESIYGNVTFIFSETKKMTLQLKIWSQNEKPVFGVFSMLHDRKTGEKKKK